MGFMNWLMKGAGFETEEVYDNTIEREKLKEERKLRQEEKQRLKAENKAVKAQKKAEKVAKKYSLEIPEKNLNSSSSEKQTNSSYSDNPDQYNMTRYDSPIGEYGSNASQNVGGYGTKNIEFVTPTKYDDVAIIIRFLKEGESVMLNLSQINDIDSQRLLDCAYGAVFALNGNIRRVDNNIFLITPEGFNLKTPTNMSGKSSL